MRFVNRPSRRVGETVPDENAGGIIKAFGEFEPAPRLLAFLGDTGGRQSRWKVPAFHIDRIKGFECVQNRLKPLERPLAIRQLVPVLPKGENCIKTFFESSGTVLGGLTFGVFDKPGEVMNYPARQRICRVAQFKLADQLLAERNNRVRWLGCGRQL